MLNAYAPPLPPHPSRRASRQSGLTEPPRSAFDVRGVKYLTDKKKIRASTPAFRLVRHPLSAIPFPLLCCACSLRVRLPWARSLLRRVSVGLLVGRRQNLHPPRTHSECRPADRLVRRTAHPFCRVWVNPHRLSARLPLVILLLFWPTYRLRKYLAKHSDREFFIVVRDP